MTFSYDGSNFYGYQRQCGKRTIQGCIEDVLTKINSNNCVSISSSGRTDAGVHAINQRATFDMSREYNLDKLRNSINKMIDDDIFVKNIKIVDNSFHARFSAKGKKYIYIINTGEYNPIERKYVYQYCNSLDFDLMEKGLKLLIGEHNFKSFVKGYNDNYVRTIYDACIVRDKLYSDKYIISFTGNGFMRYMVRNMVGLIIEVGARKRKLSDILHILDMEDRRFSGITAPSCGLYLYDVFY